MILDIRTVIQSFTPMTYIYFCIVILLLSIAFYSVSRTSRPFAMKIIVLLFIFFGFAFVSYPYLWILIIIFIGLLYSIFKDSHLQQLFIIGEDALFTNKEPQIWKQFSVPPELKSETKEESVE